MLPAAFSATGVYSARELDRARGFRLLAHAEIEAFIEDVTFEKAKASVSNWDNHQVTSETLFCLLAHYHQGFATDADKSPPFPETSRLKVKEAIKEAVTAALKQYRVLQDNNHGVREENLLRLVLPVGVRRDDLDPLWITNLNEFGKKRGDAAHRAVGVQQQIDPRTEWEVVAGVVVGLKKLDELIGALT
jgi:hypothetical protein